MGFLEDNASSISFFGDVYFSLEIIMTYMSCGHNLWGRTCGGGGGAFLCLEGKEEFDFPGT